ncbi:MAG: MerR family transcriptional regulator [Actinobacteria bacterium]|nr:MerR family transcriptional regulator [Actinomycetota bacterium]
MSSDEAAERPPVALALTVSTVARRMGVAPATLRTWDRRYGLGPSEHQPGSHRRYTSQDLARLDYMRQLVMVGIPPADAARSARERVFDDGDLVPVTQGLPAGGPVDVQPTPAARAGGGHVVAMPGGGPAARGLARAAQALDTAACLAILSDSLKRRGVVGTWEQVAVPVMAGVGDQWSASGQGVEVEHILSAAVQDALAGSIRSAPSPLNSRAVLLACAPDERHALVLWAVAAALAERRIGSRILGASLPASALANAIRRLGPGVVFVWAQMSESADPAVIDLLPVIRPAATILVGGPGWRAGTVPVPDGIIQVDNLTDTVERIAHAVGG